MVHSLKRLLETLPFLLPRYLKMFGFFLVSAQMENTRTTQFTLKSNFVLLLFSTRKIFRGCVPIERRSDVKLNDLTRIYEFETLTAVLAFCLS